VSRAKFPTTLHSHLDVTYFRYFRSSLGMNVVASWFFSLRPFLENNQQLVLALQRSSPTILM